MASSSSSFVFDEDDPPLLPDERGAASPSFPTGELDFDAFVEASPSGGHTGGDDVIMSTVAMLNKIDTSSGESDSKDIHTSILRISSTELEQMCRGVIGGSNGSRFCTRVGCAVSSHKQKADIAPISDEEYYICGLRPSQAFTTPHVPVEWIEDENEQSMIESTAKPPAVWKLFFQRLEASTSSINDGHKSSASGFKATQELGNISAAKEQLKTPKRPLRTRLSDIMEAAIDTQAASLPKRKRLVRFDDAVKVEDSIEARAAQLGMILEQWNEVILQLESLQDNYNQRVTDDQAFREKLVRANFDLQLAINQAEDMGRLLQADIGSPVIDLDGMSLWDVLERLIADGTKIKRDVDDLKTKDEDTTALKKTVSQLQYTSSKLTAWIKTQHERGNKVDIMEDNLIKFKDHYMKFYGQFRSVSDRIDALQSTVRSNSASGDKFMGNNSDGKVSELERTLALLVDDVMDLKNSIVSEGTITELERINERVKEIESRVSGDSCSINHGEFIFTSVTEVGSWLDRESVPTMGIFWDVFSALVAMAPKRLTGKERADQQYSSDRINTTIAENELAASMAYERPQTLYGDKNGNLVPWEEGFGSCKTHERWIIGTQSFKTVTTKQLKKFIHGILGNITSDTGGNGLARVLLNEVSRQWNEIVAFIDAFFQDLTETAHFPKAKAWLLVGQCCGAIFDAMEPYRAVVSQIEDLGVFSSKAQFLWCVLQCHRVMNDFIAKDFRGHPQMVKQISLFMINERVDPVAFSKMEDKIVQQASTIESLEKQVQQLKRTVGNHETFKKDIADLQKDLRKKQDK